MARCIAEKIKLEQDIKIESITRELKIIPKGTDVILARSGFLWKSKLIASKEIRAKEFCSETLAKFLIENCYYTEIEEYDKEKTVTIECLDYNCLVEDFSSMLSDLFLDVGGAK